MTKRDAKKLTALDKVKFFQNHELIEGVIAAKGTEVSFGELNEAKPWKPPLPSHLVFPVFHSDPKEKNGETVTYVCHLSIFEKTGRLGEDAKIDSFKPDSI